MSTQLLLSYLLLFLTFNTSVGTDQKLEPKVYNREDDDLSPTLRVLEIIILVCALVSTCAAIWIVCRNCVDSMDSDNFNDQRIRASDQMKGTTEKTVQMIAVDIGLPIESNV